MNTFTKYSFLLFLLNIFLICNFCFSQDTTLKYNENIYQKIENIAENNDKEIDFTEFSEQYEQLSRNKINLNNTNFDELKQIYFLNDIQINNLLNHVKNYGKLVSIYELQSVDGFDIETINKIIPFVRISNLSDDIKFSIDDIKNFSKNSVIVRYQQILEKQDGYESDSSTSISSKYLGTPQKYYLRYKYNYFNKIYAGFTAEKDPGEEFFKGTQKNGFDYYSAYFMLRDFKYIKTLILGDYNAQFGQGITFCNGLMFGKSSDIAGIKNSLPELIPHKSADENMFLRGIGSTLSYKNINLTLFYSNSKIDATSILIDSLKNNFEITSLLETGTHGLLREIKSKDILKQTIYGSHISFKKNYFEFGFTGVKTIFDNNIQKSKEPYKIFDFYGNNNSNFGVDYSFNYKNINLFGETSRSENGGFATINGIIICIGSKFAISTLYRDYGIKYQSIYSSGFSAGNKISGEQGLYYGFQLKPVNKIIVSTYIDNFCFKWLRYNIDAPSNGFDLTSQIEYQFSKKTQMLFRFRQTEKEKNYNINNFAVNVLPVKKQSFRYQISYNIDENICLKNRVEFNITKGYDKKSDYGFFFCQDISYKLTYIPLSFSARYAIFDVMDYDSRIYSYESDILYSYNISSYYKKGNKYYISAHYDFNKNIGLWIRFAQTIYDKTDKIVISPTKEEANTKSEIKIQLIVNF